MEDKRKLSDNNSQQFNKRNKVERRRYIKNDGKEANIRRKCIRIYILVYKKVFIKQTTLKNKK